MLNTDAEGRLVLADALSLAAEIEPAPDAVIDVATLTGAATVALGTGIAALFGSDDELVERLRRARRADGRAAVADAAARGLRRPHRLGGGRHEEHRAGPARPGPSPPPCCSQRFTGGLPWAHLDIAGPGRSAETSGYLSKGGTAFGVRTLLALLEDYGVAPV